MAPIQTFVFMDFGTVRGDSKKLTEVALLAVPRSQFKQEYKDPEPSDMEYKDLRSNGFVKETFKKIDDFIKQQPKPVCLLSHGGHDFDFVILKRELENLTVSLPDDVLCADCLYTFYDILKEDSKNVDSTNVEAGPDGFKDQDSKTGEEGISNPSTSNVNDTINVTSDQKADDEQVIHPQENELNEDLFEESMQKQNEETPKKRKLDDVMSLIGPYLPEKRQKLDPGKTKKRILTDSEENHTYKGKPLRKYFFNGDPKPTKGYYKLGSIYDRVVGYPPLEHHPAKNDVLSKFRISHKLGIRFLAWTNQIQIEFAKVDGKKEIVFNNRDFN